jgi:hypothetical protein
LPRVGRRTAGHCASDAASAKVVPNSEDDDDLVL